MEIWDSVVACIAAVMATAGDVEVRAVRSCAVLTPY